LGQGDEARQGDPNEPGYREGAGADSVKQHIDNDGRRRTGERATLGLARGDHTVLVVDDILTTRYATSRGLRAAGFKVVEAAGGAEALERTAGVAAVVLDVHLPDIDGFEVCRLLRAAPGTQTLPVVHVSSVFVSNEHRLRSVESGANAYLVAPVVHSDLADMMDRLLRKAAEA
jgi:CheY-like chemotaxis protein